MKERLNYRAIQRKLRQDLLLAKSSFPPRMESEMIRKKLQQNKQQSQNSSSSKPKVKRHRTDLDRLYVEYQEKVARREKEAKEEELVVKSGKARLHTREERRRRR